MSDLKVKKGSRLSADRHNRLVDLAIRQTGGAHSVIDSIGSFFRRVGGIASTGIRLKVKVIKPKFLECVAIEGVDGIDDGIIESGEIIKVARPYLLRDLASYDGVTFSAYSTDGQTKTATLGATIESHVINPKYVADCEINASPAPIGGTGVVDTNNGNEEIVWKDNNDDGREWARVE